MTITDAANGNVTLPSEARRLGNARAADGEPIRVTPTLTAAGILSILTEKKQSMAGAYGLREIGLFGSYADGLASPESDIDLLVDIECGRKSLFNFIRLKFELEELLGRKVDLVMKSALKPRLRERILNQVRYA